jgi:CBS domain-containing protein
MTVAAILRHKGHDVVSVLPTATIGEVVQVLATRRIGAVIVADDGAYPLGIVTERDIVNSLAANGVRTIEMSAGQLMTRTIRTATPGTTVSEAMTMMTAGRFRHLPVVDHGELVGIISIGDVVKARIMQQEHEVDSLKAYVSGVA